MHPLYTKFIEILGSSIPNIIHKSSLHYKLLISIENSHTIGFANK